MTTTKKPEAIDPYGARYQQLAGELAREFCPVIYPCGACQHPVIKGYCCRFCGSTSPESRKVKS